MSLLDIFRPRRESLSNNLYLQILEEEGLQMVELLHTLSDPELSKVAEHLFHFIPSSDDPRWQVAYNYMKLQEKSVSKFTLYWENALRAIYLSDKPSYREGNIRTFSEANVRQLGRAIYNLSNAKGVESALYQINGKIQDGIKFQYARTKILGGKDLVTGVTACPQAIYQLQVWESKRLLGRYIGRVGFNIHHENGANIVSFTNIQGVPNFDYRDYSNQFGQMPFNTTIELLHQYLSNADHNKEWEFRGLRNPGEEVNAALYNTVLKVSGVNRKHHHFRKKR